MAKQAQPTLALCLWGTVLPLLGALPGCNIVAPAYYMIHGPEKTKKLYGLDKTKTTVIFIDDRANRVPRRALRIVMGEQAEKTLLKEGVVKDMVTSQSALAAAGTDHSGKPLSVAEVGEAVKAQVVIYATVDSFVISPDGSTFAPSMSMRVRVVDVAADKRLWPDDPNGFPMVVRPRVQSKSVPSTTTARYQIEDELAQQAGLELAQLFYKHVAEKGIKAPE